MAIEGILFDFGGTLDSDGGHWLDRTYGLYERRHLQVPRPEIKRAFYAADAACVQADFVRHKTLRDLMTYHFEYQLQDLGVPSIEHRDWLSDQFCREAEEAYRRNAPVLDLLSRKYRLGVLSNFYGNLKEICEDAGYGSFFKVVLDSSREGVHKPDPAFFKLAVSRMELPPDRCAMVGDNLERDIVPARGLGLTTFWLTGDGKRAVTRSGVASHEVQHLGDLISYLG